VDRLSVAPEKEARMSASLQTALRMGDGLIFILDDTKDEIYPFSKHLMDPDSGVSYEEPSPNTFSFNSPYGACLSVMASAR
jgi:excinuclease ABC subunit A